jgi:thiamine pyrophosphokinase
LSQATLNRAVIFANGLLNDPESARQAILESDLLIAADGGVRHCLKLGLIPNILIGDFDSISEKELVSMQAAGTEIIRHPAKKDSTDMDLALRHAGSLSLTDILVIGALGARWDQTIANILLLVTDDLIGIRIRMIDGSQEVTLLRDIDQLTFHGQAGDILSLIPLGGDALGVTAKGLEYPLDDETLYFGATRGISNVLLNKAATIKLRGGLLLCILIHLERNEELAQDNLPKEKYH